MKILQPTYLLLLALLLFACDPIEIDKVDDEPLFTFNFNFDNQELAYAAGLDDYIMTTEVVPLANITNYTGTLEHKDNPFDNPQFALKFRIGETVLNSLDPDHFNSFEEGSVPFLAFDNALLPIGEVIFRSTYQGTGTPESYTWDYGDGDQVNFQNPIHTYNTIQNYLASVTVEDTNQCIAKSSNSVTFDNRGDCVADIQITNIDQASAVLEAYSDGQAPYTYLWSDGTTSEDNSIDILSGTDLQEECVTITDSNGCESVSCIGIIRNDAGTINTCQVEMEESNYTNARQAYQFNAVEVFYNTNDGGEYTSAEAIQPPDAYFNIISIEEFEPNSSGQRTVKIEFDFSCTVWETLATNPRIMTGSGILAVAIPN